MLVVEVPWHEAVHVHGRAVYRFAPGYFLAGQEEEVFANFTLQLNRLRIDELVVLTQDCEVISVVVVPLGDYGWWRIGMPAQCGVGMGVALVPSLGLAKARKGEDDGEKSNFHKGLSVAMRI
jgi:hypothetical protein